MKKVCSKCKIEKPLENFHKKKNGKYGRNSICKACYKQYCEANKERIAEQQKAYYEANKERMSERNKAYYEANKDRIAEQGKAYREANKERIAEQKKAHREANKQNRAEYARNKYNTDPLYKLKAVLRTRTRKAFKNNGYRKNTKTQQMLGVDWEVAKSHIERQFKKGMSWDNHGEWHIDHIIPLATANTKEELIKLCHYSNLQPLWAEDNISKKNKIEHGTQSKLRI